MYLGKKSKDNFKKWARAHSNPRIYANRRDKLVQIFDIRNVRATFENTDIHPPVFGRRLKAARLKMALAQDKLGVLVGLDEMTASARISRYENGVHEPAIKTARLIANALDVPLAYLYCEDDQMAEVILRIWKFSDSEWMGLHLFLDDL